MACVHGIRNQYTLTCLEETNGETLELTPDFDFCFVSISKIENDM